MFVSSIAGIGFNARRVPRRARPELPWSFAGSLILATSLALWLLIGSGVAALVG